MPARFRFRARGDHATITVHGCEHGSEHRVDTSVDRSAAPRTVHDDDADAVMSALGAPPHPCQVAVRSIGAARNIHDALAGRCDTPGLAFRRGGWTDGATCPACRPWSPATPAHLATPEHQAARAGGDPRLTRAAAEWLARREPLPPAGDAALLLTPAFLRAAEEIGLTGDDARSMRACGTRVEWATAVAAGLTRRTRQRLRGRPAPDRLWSALAAARNVDPAAVAAYLNAGITAHFHTYARVRATPASILTVYQATSRQQTLAGMLAAGTTIPDAVRSATAHAS